MNIDKILATKKAFSSPQAIRLMDAVRREDPAAVHVMMAAMATLAYNEDMWRTRGHFSTAKYAKMKYLLDSIVPDEQGKPLKVNVKDRSDRPKEMRDIGAFLIYDLCKEVGVEDHAIDLLLNGFEKVEYLSANEGPRFLPEYHKLLRLMKNYLRHNFNYEFES